MYHCQSCECLMINGVLCHETGCQDAWTTATRECKWCGQTFKPECADQKFCDDECAASYNG